MESWGGIKIFVGGEWVSLHDLIDRAGKIDAIKSWWYVFNQNIDSPCAKERLAEVLGVE